MRCGLVEEIAKVEAKYLPVALRWWMDEKAAAHRRHRNNVECRPLLAALVEQIGRVRRIRDPQRSQMVVTEADVRPSIATSNCWQALLL